MSDPLYQQQQQQYDAGGEPSSTDEDENGLSSDIQQEMREFMTSSSCHHNYLGAWEHTLTRDWGSTMADQVPSAPKRADSLGTGTVIGQPISQIFSATPLIIDPFSVNTGPELVGACSVLMVDTDPANREVVMQTVNSPKCSISFSPSFVADGLAAIAYVKKEPGLELILLNLDLPGAPGGVLSETIPGLATVKCLRALGFSGSIIGMSASLAMSTTEARVNGMDEFLPIPIDPDSLLSIVWANHGLSTFENGLGSSLNSALDAADDDDDPEYPERAPFAGAGGGLFAGASARSALVEW